METVLHITPREEVAEAEAKGFYRPRSLGDEGFIHCSYAHQVCRVANALFAGVTGLVLLEIDKVRTGCDVIDEDLYGSGEAFPHIYGSLPWEAVLAVHDFPCKDDGTFALPASLGYRSLEKFE
jgi:uncharacterized protein (DUF952 family)